MQKLSYQEIVSDVALLLHVDVCSFYKMINDQHLELIASKGLSEAAIGAKLNINQGLTGRVARTKHSVSIKNPTAHPDYYHIQLSGEERYQSFLGIPLNKNGQIFGVLVVQTIRPKLFYLSEIQALYEAGRKMIEIMDNQYTASCSVTDVMAI